MAQLLEAELCQAQRLSVCWELALLLLLFLFTAVVVGVNELSTANCHNLLGCVVII